MDMGKVIDKLIDALGIVALAMLCAVLITGGWQCFAWVLGVPCDIMKVFVACVGVVCGIILPLMLVLILVANIMR